MGSAQAMLFKMIPGPSCFFVPLVLNSMSNTGALESWSLHHIPVPWPQGKLRRQASGIFSYSRENKPQYPVESHKSTQHYNKKWNYVTLTPAQIHEIFPIGEWSFLAGTHISDCQKLCTVQMLPYSLSNLLYFHLLLPSSDSEEQRAAQLILDNSLVFFQGRNKRS